MKSPILDDYFDSPPEVSVNPPDASPNDEPNHSVNKAKLAAEKGAQHPVLKHATSELVTKLDRLIS